MPWDQERLQPAEIMDLYDGMLWRLSRQIEMIATQTWLIRGMMAEDERLDQVLEFFPYYRKDDGV